jgi:hypothetical protein
VKEFASRGEYRCRGDRMRRICLLIGLLLLRAAVAADTSLNTHTWWFGNSFAGGDKAASRWMMQSLDDFTVQGTRIYGLTLWDERGGEAAIYTTDGAFVKAPTGWHSWGYRGGAAVATDAKYVYYSMGHDPADGGGQNYAGVARYTLDGEPAGWRGATNGHRLAVNPDHLQKPRGLAVLNGELFVADPYSDTIQVYAAADMTLARALPVPNAGRLATDGRALWVVDTVTRAVRKYASDGKALGPAITDCLDPAALCIDQNTGDVLVADNAPTRKQVRRYRPDGTHVAGGDIGAPIYAGAAPGRVASDRFFAITGLATDAAGHLYVGGWEYGAKLRKFDTAHKEMWTLRGLEFVSCADADPGDDTSIYSPGHRYVLDYAKAPGESWREAAVTLNPQKYPDDPRLRVDPWMAVRMYRLGGHKFMLGKPQMHPEQYLWRFDGEIAVPAAMYYPQGVTRRERQAQNFSARWTGMLRPRVSGPHRLIARCTGGVTLWVDGAKRIDEWNARGTHEFETTVALQVGTRVPLKVEFCQRGTGSRLQLLWQEPNGALEAIPATAFFRGTGSAPGLRAEFYAGTNLDDASDTPDDPEPRTTTPAVMRVDAQLDYPVFTAPRFHPPAPDWPPHHPNGPFLWVDANGDGQMQAAEYAAAPAGSQATMLDPDGTLWTNTGGWKAGTGKITRVPFAGLNACGAPTWAFEKATATPIPTDTGIQHLSKLAYDPARDRMILGVWSADHPFTGGGWEQMSVGPEIQCFNHWSTTPALAWKTATTGRLPNSPAKIQKAWSLEGDYLFCTYTRKSDQSAVDVYRTADGTFLGMLLPTSEVGSTGWIDMNDAIQTHRRADGTYVVFTEEDWMAKGLYFLWKP